MAKVYTRQQRASKLLRESQKVREGAFDERVDFKGFRDVPLSALLDLEYYCSIIAMYGSYAHTCMDAPYGYAERILARVGLLEPLYSIS